MLQSVVKKRGRELPESVLSLMMRPCDVIGRGGGCVVEVPMRELLEVSTCTGKATTK